MDNQEQIEKSATKKSFSVRKFFTLFDLLEGENIRSILLSFPFLLFLVFLGVLHIANSQLGEKLVIQISKAEREIKELKWKQKTTAASLMKMSKQSEIIKMVDERGVKELHQPPFIIKENE